MSLIHFQPALFAKPVHSSRPADGGADLNFSLPNLDFAQTKHRNRHGETFTIGGGGASWAQFFGGQTGESSQSWEKEHLNRLKSFASGVDIPTYQTGENPWLSVKLPRLSGAAVLLACLNTRQSVSFSTREPLLSNFLARSDENAASVTRPICPIFVFSRSLRPSPAPHPHPVCRRCPLLNLSEYQTENSTLCRRLIRIRVVPFLQVKRSKNSALFNWQHRASPHSVDSITSRFSTV